MSIELSPERKKKADELALPFDYESDRFLEDHTGDWLDWEQNQFAADSANRVLYLEQAVEELREALIKAVGRQGFSNDELISARKTIKETENL